jgi:hypothetical protein
MQQVLFFRSSAQQSSSMVRVPQAPATTVAFSPKQRASNGSDHGSSGSDRRGRLELADLNVLGLRAS